MSGFCRLKINHMFNGNERYEPDTVKFETDFTESEPLHVKTFPNSIRR